MLPNVTLFTRLSVQIDNLRDRLLIVKNGLVTQTQRFVCLPTGYGNKCVMYLYMNVCYFKAPGERENIFYRKKGYEMF